MAAKKTSIWICVSLLASFGPASAAFAQSDAWDDGAFRVTFEALQALEPQGLRNQMVATYYTFAGRQDRVSEIDGTLPGPSLSCVGEDQDVHWQPGNEWLLQAAEGRQIVMFNETHYRIEARLFVWSLLEDLRKVGYTHLGFEAFATPATMAARAGNEPNEGAAGWSYSPDQGFYTREPAFAAFVRRAQKLGFIIFGYESSEEVPEGASPVEVREEAQANNITAQMESAGPDARFIIFAGGSHITEVPVGDREVRWMAARLKDKTEVDPLTVELTSCSYQANVETLPTDGKVALDAAGNLIVSGRYQGAVEAQVHLPVPAMSAAAAGFYRRALGMPVFVPDILREVDEPVLIRARRSDQDLEQTPVDQVLLYPNENLPLYLSPGYHYDLVGHRGDGSIVGRVRHYVE